MDDVHSLFWAVLKWGILTVSSLIVVEFFLYHKSWSILHQIKRRIRIAEDKKNYAFESTLSIINLVMTVILNLIILIVFVLCVIVLLYSIAYMTEHFFLILGAVVLVLITLIYICIKLIRKYNEQKEA